MLDFFFILWYNSYMKKRTTIRQVKEGGIYAIEVDNEIIYIGSTSRPFQIRFEEHREGIETYSNHLSLYQQMTDYERENYKFKILVDVEEAKYSNKPSKLNNYELQWMELGFIMAFKPKYNVAGLLTNYIFKLW